MTSESSMFQQSGEGTAATNEQKQQETSLNLIGEGKQYANVSVADKALADKDVYIAKLEGETKELRDKQATADAAGDILAQIKAQSTVAGVTTPSDQNATQGMNAEQVQALIDAGITAKATQAQKATNLNIAEQTLRGSFGDKAKEVYLAKSAEFKAKGIDLEDLLGKDPGLVAAYFPTGAPADPASSMVHQSSVNTASLLSSEPQTQYQKLSAQLKASGMTTERRHKLEYEALEKHGEAFLRR